MSCPSYSANAVNTTADISNYRQHILVVRLSALGDVAILQPVVNQWAASNPDTLFTVAAPPILEPLFAEGANIRFLPTQKRQSPLKLYRHLSSTHPTAVADMHWVNRVIKTDLLFMLHGIRVAHIDKSRSERRLLTRKGAMAYGKTLRPSWQRYDDVFRKLDLVPPAVDLAKLNQEFWQSQQHDTLRIGIAPFAQHKGKIWQEENLVQLIDLLSKWRNVEILLFGSRDEAETLKRWAAPYSNVRSTAGQQPFADELKIISSLTVMASMDSANMHFASCLGVPTVSIWGATHPAGGFNGWRQDLANAIQAPLPCRPCSMYGKKKCRYGDYRCLSQVTPQMVAERIEKVVGSR